MSSRKSRRRGHREAPASDVDRRASATGPNQDHDISEPHARIDDQRQLQGGTPKPSPALGANAISGRAADPGTQGANTDDDKGEQQSSAAGFATISGWVVGSLLAGIPVIVALLKLILVTKGDFQSFYTVLGSLNLTAFVGSLLVDSARVGVLGYAVAAFLCWHLLHKGGSFDRWTRRVYIVVIVIGALIGAAIAPSFWAAAVCLFAGLYALDVLQKSRSSRTAVLVSLRRSAPVAVIYGTVVLLVFQWMPLQSVALTTVAGYRWAYVVSVDDRSTTLLRLDGSIEVYPNGEVDFSQVCPQQYIARLGVLYQTQRENLLHQYLGDANPSENLKAACSATRR